MAVLSLRRISWLVIEFMCAFIVFVISYAATIFATYVLLFVALCLRGIL